MERATALVSWPSAPLTESLVRNALAAVHPAPSAESSIPDSFTKLVQWSTYDAIEHELTHAHPDTVLSSSYTIRKALIRKHYLAHCIHSYVTKNPDSILKTSVPRTWDLDISFADELDEKWCDELWDLGEALADPSHWWILKPGMADRGNGIRLFNSKEGLQRIFEEFEGDSEDEDEDEGEHAEDGTAVITSQLRHFVIQEYLPSPLLLDPGQIPLDAPARTDCLEDLQGHKFHLRAYCVASGALEVYLYTRILALFSAVPYAPPREVEPDADGEDQGGAIDLTPHLTNTSLQTHRGEEGVRLFSELVGCNILSHQDQDSSLTLTSEHIEAIIDLMSEVLAETFTAAVESPVHFQPLPNAFELYGIDFLVTHIPADPAAGAADDVPPAIPFTVQLLEINSEPAIELTGPRLTWILEDLFVAIAKLIVQPFIQRKSNNESAELSEAEIMDGDMWMGGERFGLRKCLDMEVRGAGGW